MDLDNTLYNQEQVLRYVFGKLSEFLSEEFGLSENTIFKYLLDLTKNKTLKYPIFDDLIARFGINIPVEDLIKAYRELNSEYLRKNKIILYKSALEILKENKVVVYTEGSEEIQKLKIRNIEKNYNLKLDYIIVKNKLDKKNVEIFEKYNPKAFIGDNPYTDFLIPNKVSILTIRVLTGLYRNIPNNVVKREYRPKITLRNLKGLNKTISIAR